MTLPGLLSELRERGIRLRMDGDALAYDLPEHALPESLRAAITLHKDALLALMRRSGKGSGDHVPVAAIGALDRSVPAPLSFAQERFWFLQRFVDDPAVYHVPLPLDLVGDLDEVRLRLAIDGLVVRHESLRTSYDEAGQVVRPAYVVPFDRRDISSLPASEREGALAEALRESGNTAFDLASGILMRALLVVTGDRRHVLCLTIHHIACDAWSIDILFEELRTLYGAQTIDPPIEGRLTYTDFAVWQRNVWSGDAAMQRIAAAAQELAGGATGTVLPGDRPRPGVQRHGGATRRFSLGGSSLKALRQLAVAEDASMFMALLAVTDLLLFRYTHQEDIAVGVPMAARTRPEIQRVVGCFVNTVVMCTPLTAHMSGRDLLRAVRATCLDGYANQELPFERLVDAAKIPRDLSYNPLFQVLFFVQDEPLSDHHAEGLTWSRREPDGESAKVDLSIEIDMRGDRADVVLRYNRDIFDASTIDRLGGHFTTLTSAIAGNPDIPIGDLPMLTAAERLQLRQWNSAELADAPAGSAIAWFESQAALTPDASAVVCGAERVSYAQLNERSNRLAHALIGAGIGPGERVAICCSRSIPMLQAMLATWKAGAAYVPIDPAYPEGRVDLMLEDAKPRVLLAQQGTFACAGARPMPWDVDSLSADPAYPSFNPNLRAGPDDLSHIIYTSGSTGKPKGTTIEHRSVVALLQWASEVYGGGQLAHVLASTSICFDLSVFELFAPLTVGGCVHLVENILHLPQHPGWNDITLINTVPSALQHMLGTGALPPSARVVNLAGEPLHRSLVDASYAHPQVEAVYNLYGPTEDTTYSTFALMEREGASVVTIGVPLPGKRLYILDGRLESLPVGVPGEIYLGGIGLARGYLDRPDLTRDRFILHPATGERLYRTGDLGRYRQDGHVIYMGRADSQVKVRGFRVELGEVEATLRTFPGVNEAAVTTRTDHSGATVLCAYVSGLSGAEVVTGLRHHLRERLPAFMQPTWVVALESMPMTPNGKINRFALPPPDEARPTGTGLPRRKGLENDIAQIWQELLGHELEGVNDNFFEVGGHSLLVLRMQARLRDLLGREISIVDLFRYPTIHSLADHLQSAPADTAIFNQLQDRMGKQRSALARLKSSRTVKRTPTT